MPLAVAIGPAVESLVQFLLSAIFMWGPHGPDSAKKLRLMAEKTRNFIGIHLEIALVVGLTHSYRSPSDSDRILRTVKQVHPFLSE